mgnify:CR=1 FL=1
MAGNTDVHQDARAGSNNLSSGNMFNSPVGLAFDEAGLLCVHTDGHCPNADGFAGQGNNQMLAGDTVTGKLCRFLFSPKECQITGMSWPADRRTIFVGIQHPGEDGGSQWLDMNDVPRLAAIAVRREDDRIIG